MNIESILSPSRTRCELVANSKKRAIELAAEHITSSLPGVEIGEVYRGLIEREKLGTTAIGEGVAIPHCRLGHCKSIIGGLFSLESAIDFGAHDDQPVSLMFILIVPEDERSQHLKALAMLAARFENKDYRQSLINSKSDIELYQRALLDPVGAVTKNPS